MRIDDDDDDDGNGDDDDGDGDGGDDTNGHFHESAGGPSRRTRLSGRTAGQAGRAADRLAADAWLSGCLFS